MAVNNNNLRVENSGGAVDNFSGITFN